MVFLTIARKFNSDFATGDRCPDQYVGDVVVTGCGTENPASNDSGDDFATRISVGSYQRPAAPIIIFVLESPHVSEYAQGSPRPAAGNGYGESGRALRALFKEVIPVHDYLPSGEYPLVVCNAIPYMCSLREIEKYRDKVFVKSWDAFGKDDFRARLSSLYRPGDISINACTAGKTEPKLREHVKRVLEDVCGQTTLQVKHPASWQVQINSARKGGVDPTISW